LDSNNHDIKAITLLRLAIVSPAMWLAQLAQVLSTLLELAQPVQQQMASIQQLQPLCAFLVLQAAQFAPAALQMRVLVANMGTF